LNRNKVFAVVRANIAAFGVHIQGVFDNKGQKPPFYYTVGLGSIEHPELIFVGGTQDEAQWILNNLAFRARDGVQRFDGPLEIPQFSEGFPLRLTPVADSSTHLTMANAMYRGAGRAPIPALQAMVPDATRRWPWEPGSALAATPLLADSHFDYTAPLPTVELAKHDPNAQRGSDGS
jgi:hypothetical protein